MDLLVDLHVFGPIAALVKVYHPAEEPTHFCDFVLGYARAGEFAGQSLEVAENTIEMLDIVRVERGYDHAAIGQLVDEALGRESPQGLAQRGARHAELVAKLQLP